MTPQREWELVVNACEYCDEVHFESLDCALCLVALVVTQEGPVCIAFVVLRCIV
jgi:hypothetical protein